MSLREKPKLEEKWNERNAAYMQYIIKLCRNRSTQHKASGYSFKTKNTMWSLPLVIVPTIMSPISLLVEENSDIAKYISAGAFLVTGVIGGVQSYFKYGELMTKHFNLDFQYIDLISDIEEEMIKLPPYRTQCDIFISKINKRVDELEKKLY